MMEKQINVSVIIYDLKQCNQSFHFHNRQSAINFIAQKINKTYSSQHLQIHISKQQQRVKENQEFADPCGYEVELMKEQILLFDREEQIVSYIETEKILANDPIKQLTQLSRCLFQICRQILGKNRSFLAFQPKSDGYTKQKLDTIQMQCLNTLQRIREERRRMQNCCICLTKYSSRILLPCMHLVLCSQCSQQPLPRCPICSQPIIQIKQVYQ